MRRELLFAFGSLAASGCLFFGPSYYDDSAVWSEPELYGRLPSEGSRGDYRFAVDEPGRGLPLESENLTSRWGTYALRSLEENLDSSSWDRRLVVSPDWDSEARYEISGNFPTDAGNAEVREAFRSFAAHFVHEEPEGLEALTDAFADSKTVGGYRIDSNGTSKTLYYSYSVQVDSLGRLSAWYADARVGGSDYSGPPVNPGRAALTYGNWSLDFSLSVKKVTLRNEQGRFELAVDPNDYARFHHTGREPLSDDAAGEMLRRFFTDLDLGELSLTKTKFRHLHGD